MEKEERKQSISEIIEEVRHEICENYCKYSDTYTDGDDLPEICKTKCPLDRL